MDMEQIRWNRSMDDHMAMIYKKTACSNAPPKGALIRQN